MTRSTISEPGSDSQTAAIGRDLEALFAVPVPEFATPDFSSGKRPARLLRPRPWRRLALVGAAAALLVGGAVAAPLVTGGGTEQVSALAILERSSQSASTLASANGKPYHLVAETTYDNKGISTTTETWYGGGGLLRTETRSQEATGATVFGLASDGTTSWMYYTAGSETRVARGSAQDLPLSLVTGLVPASGDPAEALANYTVPGCNQPVNEGQETKGSRQAYVVRIDYGCPTDATGPAAEKLKQATSGLKQTDRFWVDTETFVILQREVTVGSDVTYRYNVTTFDVGDTGGGNFTYQPPAGAKITDVASLSDAKSAIAPDTTTGSK